MPERIQQRRVKGWRKPDNTVSVARPSKWGNPYKVGGEFVIRVYEDDLRFIGIAQQSGRITPAVAVTLYRHLWLTTSAVGDRPHRGHLDPEELRGKNLMCFCPLDMPCHADVLLELAIT